MTDASEREFEWDSAKRERNLAKHGFDFQHAVGLFSGPTLDGKNRQVGGEERFLTVGMADGRLAAVVWTDRDGAIRVISMRRARVGERRGYAALHGV